MNSQSHLMLQQIVVATSKDWTPEFPGWTMIRLGHGYGYWVEPGSSREIKIAEVVVTPAQARGQFRASCLADSVLQYFYVQPELLLWLLTLPEFRFLEGLAANPEKPVRIIASTDDIARRFGEICDQGNSNSLPTRTQLLQLFVDLFAHSVEAARSRDTEQRLPDSRQRLKQMMDQMPETDLMNIPAHRLASKMNCSARHFNRLFLEEFGVSLRSKQTIMRMKRACYLLQDPEVKIIDVASECGYESLGLFNATFKKHFRTSPGLWRKYQEEKHRVRSPRRLSGAALATVVAVVMLLLGGLNALAVKDASAAERRPDNSTPMTFEVNDYRVEGNTLLPTNTVAKVFEGYHGKKVSVDQIREAVSSLVLAYRARGYVTVGVSLPPQQITNGVVRVNVVEGKLSDIRVSGNHYFSSNNVMRALPGLRTNLILNGKMFQAELDRANANRDRQIYPEIQPGPEPGTSALVLGVKDRFPLHGKVELNNQSTPGTPDLRVNTSIAYQNLWQREHSIGVQYGFTPQDFKETNPRNYPFYDLPLVANYSGFYRIPLQRPESIEEQMAAKPLSFGYDEASRQFRLPPSSGLADLTLYAAGSTSDTGVKLGPLVNMDPSKNQSTNKLSTTSQDSGRDLTDNGILGLRIGKPLPEMAKIKSSLSFGFDFKSFRLASYNTNNFVYSLNYTNQTTGLYDPVQSEVHSPQAVRQLSAQYLPFSLRWDAFRPDKYGSTSLGLNASVNLPFDPFSGRSDFEAISGKSQTSGQYVTLTPSFTRDQRIYEEWTMLMRADGQWANEPLISNEQFAVGGVGGVRGYQEGEQYGDRGWRVSLEPRTPVVDVGLVDGTMPMRLRGSVFMDYGQTYFIDSSGQKSGPALWGTGCGLSITIGNSLDLRLILAWPLMNTPYTTAGSGRVHFMVGAQF